MDLRRLRDFIALAEELHFENAARRVVSAQSPFSRRIAGFERELGQRLFKRTTRGTQLSGAGKIFLPWTRLLVAKKEQALRALATASSAVQGELHIGICDEIPLAQLSRLLALFRIHEPHVDIQVVDRPLQLADPKYSGGSFGYRIWSWLL